jgi:hypothetical protein
MVVEGEKGSYFFYISKPKVGALILFEVLLNEKLFVSLIF